MFRSPHPADRARRFARGLARLAAGTTVLLIVLLAAACQYDRESRLAEIRTLHASGRFDESIAPLRVLLAAEPDQPEANFRLGVALVQTGRPSLAIWPLQKAAQSEQLKIQGGLLLASTLLATDSYEETIRAADQVLAVEPDHVAALYTRAQADIGAGRPADALVDSEHILQLRPEDFLGSTLRVAALVDLERFDEAEETHIRLIQATEEKGELELAGRACSILAQFYRSQEDLEKAVATMLDCFKRFPTNSVVQQSASDFFVQIQQRDQAIEIWRGAVEHTPEDMGLRSKLAYLLYESGRTEEAEAAYKETVDLFDSRAAWQMLSVFYRSIDRIQEAREALEKALERAKREPPDLLFALADILIAEGNYERAEEIAASLREPSYRTLLRGSIALAQGDPAKALKLIEPGLRLWPNNPGARYIAGQAALQLGDLTRALAEYREATRVGEEATDAALAMAQIYYSLHKYPTAMQFAERHIKTRPFENGDAHVIAVRSAAEQGLWGKAASLLELLDKRKGMHVLVVVERAGVMRKKEGFEAAAKVIEDSGLDITDPENTLALTSLSMDFISLEEDAKALARADRALAKHPDNPAFLDLRARILARMGRDEEARATIDKALAGDPDYGPALEAKGMFAEHQDKLAEALKSFDDAVAVDPLNPEYAYRAALVVLRQGNIEDAIARLRKIVSLAPGHAAAVNDLAWGLAESGEELDLALELAQRAAQLSRGPQTLDTLGWVQFKRGDVDAALDSFEAALEDGPDSPSVRYRMALVLNRKGDAAGARQNLARALAGPVFPEVKAAQAELARLESN
jgi:tetratricopeptide (TPR) repeat protein